MPALRAFGRTLLLVVLPARGYEALTGWISAVPYLAATTAVLVQRWQDLGWPWWVATAATVLFLLALHAAWLNQYRLDVLAEQPRPNLVYVGPSPAASAVMMRMQLGSAVTGMARYVQNANTSRGAKFARVQFRNESRLSPRTTRLDRPQLTALFLDAHENLVERVTAVRIAGTKERYPTMFTGEPIPETDLRLAEVRVGEYLVVDLLMRFDDAGEAHTWSNHPGVIGNTDFPPGIYQVQLEIDGENLPLTQRETFWLTVPVARGAYLEVSRDRPAP